MNIHEYQAKELLSRYGVPVPEGGVAQTPPEAEAIAARLGGPCVIKAQVHAGGRGKGGGIALVNTPAEALEAASRIIGMRLVTHQTGPSGRLVRKVLVERACPIKRELYLGAVVDRALAKPVVMACPEGGVEIEEVARRSPEKIVKEVVDPAIGLQPYQGRHLALGLGLDRARMGEAVRVVSGLYQAFMDNDCSLAEINPLVEREDGTLVALDVKLNFDASALFRHKETQSLRDTEEEDPREMDAAAVGLSYVTMEGNIGCLVNGAGLAMATMDIIKLYGGEPANFLDVGGGASKEAVAHGFRLVLEDKKVKGVLVNIFGGIARCDVIADGIVASARQLSIRVPIVVRMEGTNVEEGRRILADSGLNIIYGEGMEDAARKIVEAVHRA